MHIIAGKDLLLAYGVANLPDQAEVFARRFAETPDIFHEGVYRPTKEDAGIYSQTPSHLGLCSLKGMEEEDLLNDFVIKNLRPINEKLRTWSGRILRKRVEDDDSMPEHFITLKTVRTTMNLLAALYVPIFLAGTLGVLSRLHSEGMRVVVLGLLGIVLTLSLICVVPKVKRNNLVATTAAYFAVGGIYIGAKGSGSK